MDAQIRSWEEREDLSIDLDGEYAITDRLELILELRDVQGATGRYAV